MFGKPSDDAGIDINNLNKFVVSSNRLADR